MATTEFNAREAWVNSNKRLEDIAKEAGEKATQAVAELLERHEGIITPVAAELLKSAEGMHATDERRKQIESGKDNSQASRQAGLTAFFTPDGIKRLRGVARDYAGESATSPLRTYLTEIEPVDDEVTAYALRLPEGTYHIGWGGGQFFGRGGVSDINMGDINAAKAFRTRYDDVLRIDGDAGEFWHNTGYKIDGTPKT